MTTEIKTASYQRKLALGYDMSTTHPKRKKHFPLLKSRLVFLGLFLAALQLLPLVSRGQGVLSNGGHHSGSISAGGETDEWTLNLEEGEFAWIRIAVTDSEGSFALGFDVFTPDGTRQSTTVTSGSYSFYAEESGAFSILVHDRNRINSGTYRFEVHVLPSAEWIIEEGDDGGTLTNGGHQEGQITAQDVDRWTLNLEEGEFAWIRIAVTDSEGSFALGFDVFTPDGTRQSTTVTSGSYSFYAEESGAFSILVHDRNRINLGTYVAAAVTQPQFYSVSEGDEGGLVSTTANNLGEITYSDFDLWHFDAAVGNEVTVTVTELIDNDDFAPRVLIYSPSGEEIASLTNPVEATFTFTAPENCRYVVVVTNDETPNEGTGTYQVEVTGIPEQSNRLWIRRSGQRSIELRWPSELEGYTLEQTFLLGPEITWTDVAKSPDDNGLIKELVVLTLDDEVYFRLTAGE